VFQSGVNIGEKIVFCSSFILDCTFRKST